MALEPINIWKIIRFGSVYQFLFITMQAIFIGQFLRIGKEIGQCNVKTRLGAFTLIESENCHYPLCNMCSTMNFLRAHPRVISVLFKVKTLCNGCYCHVCLLQFVIGNATTQPAMPVATPQPVIRKIIKRIVAPAVSRPAAQVVTNNPGGIIRTVLAGTDRELLQPAALQTTTAGGVRQVIQTVVRQPQKIIQTVQRPITQTGSSSFQLSYSIYHFVVKDAKSLSTH